MANYISRAGPALSLAARSQINRFAGATISRRFFQEVNIPSIEPIPRPNEKIDTKRARLVYQSRKRGMLENCLIFSNFAAVHLDKMDMNELHQYDKLLDENDWSIFAWLTDKEAIPEKHNNNMFKTLYAYAKNDRKEALRMPKL